MGGNMAIEVVNISKQYNLHHGSFGETAGAFWALKDVSFQINRGEMVGVIGNNGSGKSTLLKILSQITRPSAGEVRFYGTATSILEIGTNFHPDLTGRQNVELHLQLMRVPKNEFAAFEKQIQDFSEIGDFFDEPVKVYSSGMFLRLAFSMAFHLSADIILLDEVISVGDEGFRLKCQDMLKQIQQQGKTILFVSHNRLEILELSNRCIWLDKGSVRRDGNSASVLSEYFAMHRDNYDGKKIVIDTHQPQVSQTEQQDGTVHIKWDEANAPGNDMLLIRELIVGPQSGSGPLVNTDGVQLKFIIDKKREGVQIGAFFFLQDIFYQPVLVGHFLNNTEGIDYSRQIKNYTGLVEISCVIPPYFLLPGKYYLLPRFGMEEHEWNITSEEVFRFSEKLHFTIHNGDGYRELIGDVSKGSVRPPLQWGIAMAE